MATQTRFDLTAAIENWRNELAAQPQLTPDDRRELEKHLADTMAELRQRGLNDEESFWLARKRVGPPQQLAEEFEKADPAKVWRERMFYIALVLFAVSLWQEICNLIFWSVDAMLENTKFSLIIHRFPQEMVRLSIQILRILPILWLGFFLASGIGNPSSVKSLRGVLQSRFRLITVSISLTLLIAIFETWQYLGFPSAHGSSVTDWCFLTANDLFGASNLPLAWIALMAWLMPAQNRKVLKSI